MAQAPRDENRVTAFLGTSNADGTTTLPVYVDSATNRLLVTGVGGGGTSATDDSAFTAGSGSGTPMMGFATSDSVDANDVGVVAMTTARALHVAVQSGGGGTQYAVQAAAGGTDTGNLTLVQRNDTLADLSGGDGQYSPLQVNASGALYIQEGSALSVTESTPIAGFATSALQLPDGHAVTIDNIVTNEVFVRGSQSAGAAVDGEVVTVQGIASMTPLSVTESSPLTGFATSAKQLADGHNVTIDNISTNEVYVRGGGTAGSPTDGEVLAVQGIIGADAVTISGAVTTTGTVAVTNDSLIGAGDPTIDSYAHIAINLTVGADQVLVSSAADKQIWVYGVAFTCSIAGTVSFQDEDDTAITGVMDFAGNSGLGIPTSGNFAMPIWKLATNKDLEVDVLLADIDGWLDYAIVSV